jgi:hypothetical protein
MLAGAVGIPLLLWRGELRAQGLLLRSRLLTALQGLVGLGILCMIVLRVREVLSTTGLLPPLRLAILSVSYCVIMAANVTLLGERTGTLPWQLQRWAATLPLRPSQVGQVVVAFSVLKSALFTLALLGAVAVGSVLDAASAASVLVILSSALILPLLPVAIGLQWARRRSASVSIAFTVAPLGLILVSLTMALPHTSGWVSSALSVLALPGAVIAGRVPVAESAIFLAGWLGAAAIALRPAALSLRDGLDRSWYRSSISPLVRDSESGRGRWLPFDIAIHRLGLVDAGELIILGVVSSLVVLLVQSSGSTIGELGAVMATSTAAAMATVAGYLQIRSDVELEPVAEAWIRTLPVSRRSLTIARHVLCSAGGLLAICPVVFTAFVKGQGLAAPNAYSLAVWTLLPAWTLSGWFAWYMSRQTWRRHVAGYVLVAGYSARALIGGVLLVVVHTPIALPLILLVDLAVGAIGHWRAMFAEST